MKKGYLLLMLFILFFACAGVSAGDNATILDDSVLEASDDVNLTESVDEPVLEASSKVSKISTKDLVKYHKNDSQFTFKLLDSKNKPVSGKNVVLKIKGVEYNRTSDKLGMGKLDIGLVPGDYVITTSCDGISVNNTIKVLARLSGQDISSTYGTKTKFSVKLVDNNGKVMNNVSVTFKINSKKYKRFTNSDGIASVSLKYDSGKYVIRYSADGVSSKNTYEVKNYYKLSSYNWNSGADVTKNKKIKDNLPNSNLVRKVVKAAKSGTPIIKFKGGKGKTVFITAGVHGNELSSQIAALQLIKYLQTHPINGTVYIIPFMNPKATASNVRDYGVKLNSYADKPGTISYKTVKLIVKFKCDAYGDFHCTRPGGDPGKDVAMGTYSPTPDSAKLATYIAKNSKVSSLIYGIAGDEYPGALEDVVNLKHIPAVTCEVKTPHGTIASGSVPKSLSMMKSFLKFSSLI